MSEITFVPDEGSFDELRAALRQAAPGRPYVVERLTLHCHLHDAASVSPRDIVKGYLECLGYKAAAASALSEIDAELGIEVAISVLHWDLARSEEMVLAETAAHLTSLLTSVVEPWAVLAFTGISLPKRPIGPLCGRAFVRVVADEDAEGGVLFLGEGAIAMIWAKDDDGPTRGIEDVHRRPSISKRR